VESITWKSTSLAIIVLALILVFLFIATPLVSTKAVLAEYPPSILKWSFVDTPSIDGNVIVSPSEINRIAFGPDDRAMYAVDIPNSLLYKSTDSGITWDNSVTNQLVVAGALLPVWDIAVSQDDANFVVAITDGTGLPIPNGPKNVFVSTDGGQNWQNTNLTLPLLTDFISCVAISPQYDVDKRYIAIATRDGTGGGNGKVFTFKAPGPSIWVDQTIAPCLNWVAGDVVALKFSPSYNLDNTIVIVFASGGGLFLNIGTHDTVNNTTTWKVGVGFPVKITASDGSSPTNAQIITADLELPSDFSGADPGTKRRYFLSFDARNGGIAYFSGVYRIDDTIVFQLMYNTSLIAAPDKRISSIAYRGTYASGKLIAGETTTTDTTKGVVNIWLCSDPLTILPPPGWRISDVMKSPTGGGNRTIPPPPPPPTYGLANAFLIWSTNSDKVYCGTSSATLTQGGLLPGGIPSNQWPGGLWNGFALDESAFSISLDGGDIWNQLSLIDTEITSLTDVAAIEAPEDSEEHDVLYLASVNTNGVVANNFDSIWRSISDPLGMHWERILCTLTTNNDIILRLNPRISEDNVRSKAIVFADRGTDNIRYSADEGRYWQVLYPGWTVTDFTLASDSVIYILNDIYVLKGTYDGTAWKWGARELTGLTTGHTITTPLKNPKGKRGHIEDWVIVGSSITGEVAWADFSQPVIKFLPPLGQRVRTPVQGDIHVLADEQFEANKTIYAASRVANGKIYRWIIDKSTTWDELVPINSDFYGIEQKKGVLYGAYNVPAVPGTPHGVDRTLYPLTPVPPPLDWDDLTADLPATVHFTREPSSLKASTSTDNNLWAIDNTPFIWATKQGCLWNYTDTLAKNGPWTTAPPSSGVIPIDPVTGRANETNFAWRQLSYAQGYELQIAKDDIFSLRVFVSDNIVPPNPLSPAQVILPGFLDANHKYFWRVRASSASTGEVIHSPWSATMYFTTMAGFAVQSSHLGPTLLQPPNNCTGCTTSPAFSWSPMFQTTKYQFILAKDAELSQVVDNVIVTTTSYQHKGKLDTGVTYYWQVQAIEPVVSEPSPIGCFTVTGKEQPGIMTLLGISDSASLAAWIGIALYAAFIIFMIIMIIKIRYRRRREED
jgi:hypothetical protein